MRSQKLKDIKQKYPQHSQSANKLPPTIPKDSTMSKSVPDLNEGFGGNLYAYIS